jgi:ABC-type antimicrobial peptide transport system permease subunit
MVDQVRLAILTDAPELAWASVTPMERFLEPHVQPWRLGAGVFAIFGLLALLVAAVGLYGSLAYSVATRGREFGVRGALGASSPDLVRQVVGEGVRLTAIGVVIGVAASLIGGRFAAALLFETSPSDPAVFIAVAVVLLATATVASLVPAFRAARVAPADSLRSE